MFSMPFRLRRVPGQPTMCILNAEHDPELKSLFGSHLNCLQAMPASLPLLLNTIDTKVCRWHGAYVPSSAKDRGCNLQVLSVLLSYMQSCNNFLISQFYLCFICENLWLNRKCFHRGFQTCRVRDVQHRRRFINALHETAQSRAGAEFDEPRKALRQQSAHGILPQD